MFFKCRQVKPGGNQTLEMGEQALCRLKSLYVPFSKKRALGFYRDEEELHLANVLTRVASCAGGIRGKRGGGMRLPILAYIRKPPRFQSDFQHRLIAVEKRGGNLIKGEPIDNNSPIS